MSIYEEAQQLQEEITQIRRTFHRHPEIGRTEFRTSKLIREAGGPGAEAVGKLVAKALKALRKAAGTADENAAVDASQLDEIERCVRDLRAIAGPDRPRSDAEAAGSK